ncbi:AI-2E family transporter [Azospirillum sp. A39]|uniref:AI-2E family transporter n=1 Tax=Azospirillum sp. A39 TaxID=3462279 RepID=UPI00404679CC
MDTDFGRFVGRALVLFLLLALALFLWRIVDVLLLVFGAVLLAVVLRALADGIGRTLHLSSGWALAVAVLLVLAVLGVSGWLFGREMSAQVDELVRLVPESWGKVRGYLQDHAWGRAVLGQLDSLDVGSVSGGLVGSARSVLTTTLGVVGNVLLVAAGAAYLAAQPGLYRDGIVALVPRGREEAARDALDATGDGLRQWLKGQFVSMSVIGVLTTLGLWVLGVPSALALGLLAGLAEFVPLVGPIASAIPALLVASAEGMNTVLYVLVLYVVVQQVESNLITPLVQRELVSLPPALTLFAVVAMGALFGAMGVLLATPLTVVAFVLIRRLYVCRALGKDEAAPP